tara:strand:- start:493 stop:1119 length:627 start_codon:yes stop_codon:yes gene_type:complete
MMTHEAIPANRWLQGHRLVQTIDAISVWVGRAGAVLVAVLTAIVCYEVFSRYVLNSPHDWAFDASYMLFGTSFMLAGAYALAKSAHVRGDLIYAGLSARTQAALDLVLYVLFFIPGVLALVIGGYSFAIDSWAIGEGSPYSLDGVPVYPFKAMIPIAGAVLLLQAVAEILRCVLCLREGEWPERASDVNEVDLDKIQATLNATEDATR